MHGIVSGATRAPVLLCLAAGWLAATPVRAQPAPETTALPDLVVTADRTPEPIERSGSAISVVTRQAIQRFNPTSLGDAPRSVPGLDITETGRAGPPPTRRTRETRAGDT